jgi:hypothetical protein
MVACQERRRLELLAIVRAIASMPGAWRDCPAVAVFFEVSRYSFCRALAGGKGREGWGVLRSGGRKVVSNPMQVVERWIKHWCVLKGESSAG